MTIRELLGLSGATIGCFVASSVAGCVPPQISRTVTPGIAHGDLVYAFEVDSVAAGSDWIRVVICHRFGYPPCVTMSPATLDYSKEYAAWRADAARRSAQSLGAAGSNQSGSQEQTAPQSEIRPEGVE